MESLNYGLNTRDVSGKVVERKGRDERVPRPSKKKKGLTGFGGSDDDEDDDDPTSSVGGGGGDSSGRSAVNREIAAEQAALRKRAAAAIAAADGSAGTSLYDYDAEFDSFASGGAASAEERRRAVDQKAPAAGGKKLESRYVSKLLKTAERRDREQEIVSERIVAREQAEEDADLRYDGKEKFVTKAYKRKLAEREVWAREDDERTRQEEEEDVTKTKKGGNFLYGGFNRNVIMGAACDDDTTTKSANEISRGNHNDEPQKDDHGNSDHKSSRVTKKCGMSKKLGNPQWDDMNSSGEGISEQPKEHYIEGDAKPKIKSRRELLAERSVKIREARKRYFERNANTTKQ